MMLSPIFADALAHVLDENWFGPVTKYQLLAVFAAVIVAGLMIPLAKRVSTGEPVRGALWNMLEALLLFIRDEVARPNIHSGHDHHPETPTDAESHKHEAEEAHKDPQHYLADKFVPFLWTLFLFILFANLLGLIPGSYTVTSQIIVTAVFAVGIYGLSLVLGFSLHGMKFLGILVPPGTPGWLLPLMIPIELISQLARPISLAVRLFANMTAGHVILGVLFGLAISGGLLIGWLPFAFTIAMNGLEVGIAFIQAYIFTVLSCVYLGDAVTLHGHSEHAH